MPAFLKLVGRLLCIQHLVLKDLVHSITTQSELSTHASRHCRCVDAAL